MTIIFSLFFIFVIFYGMNKIGYENINIPEWLDSLLEIIILVFIILGSIYVFIMSNF